MTDPPAFEVLAPPGPPAPIVGHVPHAGTHLPAEERARLLPGDDVLARERLRLTDAHTDRLFDWLRDLGATLLVNRTSRLVVDPERFEDDAVEPMAGVGQGAVYTRTTMGEPLRDPDPAAREQLLDRWYRPWHAALDALVAGNLERFGRCLVVDGHSFASVPLPSEPDQDPVRPDVCLGTDPFHTPAALPAALRPALEAEGFRVAIDRPFAGALVPLRRYRRDPRVTAIMLEIRRGTHLDESTGVPLPGFDEVVARLRRAIEPVLREG